MPLRYVIKASTRQRGDMLTPENCAVYLNKLNLKPTVVGLQN